MNQNISTCNYLVLMMLFALVVVTFVKGLILLQCYAMMLTIQTDYRLEREAVANRQREIMTRLSSIEICVDAKRDVQ